MTDGESGKMYRYRCKSDSCGVDVCTPNLHCKGCGFVAGLFETSDPSLGYVVICEKCRQPLAMEELPSLCSSCHTRTLEWWNVGQEAWFQPDLGLIDDADKESVWLAGDFDGKYDGQFRELGILVNQAGQREYPVVIKEGVLRNARRIAGPPASIAASEPRPIRQREVNGVRVESVDQAPHVIPVILSDFRLHDWSVIGHKEVPETRLLTGQHVLGRIQGKGYGCIRRLQDKISLPVEKAEVKQPVPQNSVQKQSLQMGSMPQTPLPIGSTSQSTLPSGSTSSFFPDVVTVYHQCFSCSWLFQALLTAIIWIGCGWKLALFGSLLVMRIACWLDQWVVLNGKRIQTRTRLFSLGLVVLSAFGILLYLYMLRHDGCAEARFWPLILSMLSLLLAALIDSCWLKFVLSSLWFLALMCWCGAQIGGCRISHPQWTQPISSSLGQVGLRIDSFFSFDGVSSRVSNATQGLSGSEGQRFSVDEVKNNPTLLNDCRNSLYFSDTNFGLDSDAITLAAADQLKKLDSLRTTISNARIVIVGYSDRSGDGTPDGVFHNIELSERRANAVAKLLIEEVHWNADLIEVRGEGSRRPLRDSPGPDEVNRRVELKLRCTIPHAAQEKPP